MTRLLGKDKGKVHHTPIREHRHVLIFLS